MNATDNRKLSSIELAQQILAEWKKRFGDQWQNLGDANKQQQLAELAEFEAWITLQSLVATSPADIDRLARDRKHVVAQFSAIAAIDMTAAGNWLNEALQVVISGALKILIAAI